jgi:RNA polymerase sigma-70 factor (ECF subfamily)
MSKSDRILVERLLEGDERALREFFDEYFDRLYRFALSRLRRDSGLAPGLAEEAAQRTLCRAVRRLDSFRGDASLFSWLAAICRNELADLLEVAQRDAARHVSLDSDPVGQRAASQQAGDVRQQPEEETAADERIERIDSILRQLPGRYGEMLRWKYLDDLSTEAIAERLAVSHDAAQSALQRARAAFKSAALAAGLEV